MKVIEVAQPGGPEVLRAAERALPEPGPREVLVKVRASGVNRPDLMQREGKYPPPPGTSDIPGLEISGQIVTMGQDARRFQRGDWICALLAGGGYAEYCVAPEGQCLPIPGQLDPIVAGAIPETFFTVWTNAFDRGRLVSGESLLVHGGASGIGTTAIQMAKARGARVFATARSAAQCAACQELGAERAIDSTREDFVAITQQLTNGQGVDVILDMVGGDFFSKNLQALAPEGRLVQIATLAGSDVELSLRQVMQRRLSITGSTLRSRTVEEKGRIAQSLEREIWPLVAKGQIKPIIQAALPWHQAVEAHRTLESGQHVGKIVLVWS